MSVRGELVGKGVLSDFTEPIHSLICECVIAFAAGDAYGAAYEFKESLKPTTELLENESWQRGGVSDDTMLSLITIGILPERDPLKAQSDFLTDLKIASPKLRGLGPTTTAALGLPVKENEQKLVGFSNGAMMRLALTGLALPANSTSAKWIESVAGATHKSAKSKQAAIFLSMLFSELLLKQNYERAQENALSLIENPEPELIELLGNQSDYLPPTQGVGLDPFETLAAVLYIASKSTTVISALMLAAEIGGDTDTTGALAASLTVLRNPGKHELFNIPWLPEILWQEVPDFKEKLDLIVNKISN